MIISPMVEILATFADTLMLIWFVSKMLGVSLQRKMWQLIIPFFQLIVQLLFDKLMPGFSLLPMMIMLLFVFAFALSLSPKTFWWDALTSIAYISLMMIANSVVFSVFPFFIDNINDVIHGSDSKSRILYIIIAKLMLFFTYKLVIVMLKKEKNIEIANAIMTLTLTLATIVSLSALMKITAVVDTNIIDTSVLILVFSLLLINLVLYLFVSKIQKLQKSKYELKLMNERIALETKQAGDANIIWNNIRRVRHDIKNHLSVIKGYLEQGDTNACFDYIDSIHQTVESMGTLIRSGNSVIDYMINSKLSNLEGVQVLISGYVGNFNDISDADMVCILGNILDNAVEALPSSSKTQRIELYFSKVKRNRLIICKNSVSAPVLQNNKKLLSTKPHAEAHGLGHQIVETTVKKYGGLVGYFEEDELFGVEISIPEPLVE